MKNLLIIFCLLVFPILSCVAQNKDTEKFKAQFILEDNPVKVADNAYDGIFNLYSLSTVKKIKRWNKEDWMVKYSSKINEMVILNSIPIPERMANSIVNDVLKFCKENEYKNAIKDDDTNNSMSFFCKYNDEKITGLIIISIVAFSEDVKNVEVRCIDGIFSSENVNEIFKKHGDGYREVYWELDI